MADASLQLPPGWVAQWDETHQRHLFIAFPGIDRFDKPVDQVNGHTQWDPPTEEPQQPSIQGPPPASGKRRQYAAGQTQAYYGEATPAQPSYAGDQHYAGATGAAAPGQATFFSPAEQQPQQHQPLQQQQSQTPWFGSVGAIGGNFTGGYAPNPAYNQPPASAMADQFSQMSIQQQQGYGQKQFSLQTVNVIGAFLDPRELLSPPPEIRLPPGATLSNSPTVNADYTYQRCTMNAIPTTNSLLSKSKLPFGLILTPYRSLNKGEESVPLVTDQVIARCRRCRTYINPYCTFIDGGGRWKCCMCNVANEVPQMFDWDAATNQQGDRWSRAELNHGVVEYIAPAEYLARPPQPPVYVFLLDVSQQGVASGMLATACRTILESLERLPNGDDRTKVAIVGFDVSLYFFTIPPGSTESTMLVVSDLDDVFIPRPDDLLVNLTECRQGLEALLSRFSEMFQDTHNVGSCLGPALQAGYKLISSVGGKVIVCTASLPSLGSVGALKNREDPKMLGTTKESSLLQAADVFYKTFAIECSRSHVSVDMFLFSSTYQDVASLSCLPHYTGGNTFFYPAFSAAKSEDALKFAHEFGEVLASPIMLEVLMRVRASRGLRMASFHGNFFVRSTDLLTIPAVPHDQSYAIEVEIEDNITSPFVVVQTALLHTTAFGERRVRVVTTAYPTTSNMSEMYASADQIAIAHLLANKAVERSVSSKLEDARDALTNKMIDILTVYKNTMTASGGGASAALSLAENMKFLPILVLGVLKHVGIRASSQIPSDLRAYAQTLLTTLPSQMLIPYIHPTFYSLHNMPPECGTIGEHGVILPPPLPLTSERLERHGLYLIEDGQTIFIWVGRDAVPQLVMDVFDLPAYDALRGGKATLPILENSFSQRINAIVNKTREMRRGPYWAHLYVVKEDGEPALRLWALSFLIQDRSEQSPSYPQYLTQLKERVRIRTE
ncbi:COPII subunit [Tulasnella sp. 330]|nr:COPII subunit [Tulasnella sp. 330]KAG8874655.1 COPII subunit [Tulasnella sp. 331]